MAGESHSGGVHWDGVRRWEWHGRLCSDLGALLPSEMLLRKMLSVFRFPGKHSEDTEQIQDFCLREIAERDFETCIVRWKNSKKSGLV